MKNAMIRKSVFSAKGNLLCLFLALFLLLIATVSTGYCANVTCFGDSITAGNTSGTGGYPPKLNSLLNGNGKPSIVVNKGISGEKTPAGVARFDSVLASFPANLILIMEGTNDIRGGLSVQTTEFNLQTMINKAKAQGVTPVLATLTPSNLAGSEVLIPGTWNPMITSLAKNNGVRLSDHYSAILPTWGSSNSDGIHPNDTGYFTLANTWYNSIAGMINSNGEVNSGDSGGSSGGGGGGGCFIATAAFGSPVEKNVELLKEFRDQILLPTFLGQKFVQAYYKYSPPVADFIRQHEAVKLAVRVLLYPLIGISFILLKMSVPMLLIASLFLTGVTIAVAIYSRRQKTTQEAH